MNISDLVRTLAEDDHRPRLGLATRLTAAVSAGGLASGLMLVWVAGFRPDFPGAALSWYVQLKFAFAIVLAITTVVALVGVAQPDSRTLRPLPIVAAPMLLVAGIVLEMATTPAGDWLPAAMGKSPLLCLVAVPLLSAAPLVAALSAMREAAPASPGRAGALTGLLGGAIGATVYMLRCTDDAPLFVGTWYVLAMLSMAAAGWLLGRVVPRW